MKNVKTFLFTIIGIFLLFSCSASAASTVTTSEIYSLANGDYLETILIQDSTSRATSSTKSGQKTTYYKSSSGVTLWSVTVKASFSYTYGKSSTCTSVTGSSASSSVAWKVSSASSKKNGNTATASATGYHYTNGALVESLSRSVSLSCDIYGYLS